MHHVTDIDEWCTETYMETDYLILTEEVFIKTIKDYVSFYFSRGLLAETTINPFHNKIISLKDRKWKYIKLSPNIFDVCGSKSFIKTQIKEYDIGEYSYVSTSSENNGIEGFYNKYTEKGNVLTIDSATIGSCFYQYKNFTASDHVEKLIPKFNMNKYTALFLTTIIELEKFRYGYGRKFVQMRIKKMEIKLPIDNNNNLDWEFMENYIKSLPYSANLGNV